MNIGGKEYRLIVNSSSYYVLQVLEKDREIQWSKVNGDAVNSVHCDVWKNVYRFCHLEPSSVEEAYKYWLEMPEEERNGY